MTMEMMHRDSGACNTTGRRFTYDLQYASDQSSEIAIVVFNYPNTAHPKLKFKQHYIVELVRAEDIDLIKPEDGDTHNPIWGKLSIHDGTPTIKASGKEHDQQRSRAATKKRSMRQTKQTASKDIEVSERDRC
jgi:hypothetical protein